MQVVLYIVDLHAFISIFLLQWDAGHTVKQEVPVKCSAVLLGSPWSDSSLGPGSRVLRQRVCPQAPRWKPGSSPALPSSLPPGGINYRAEGFTSEKYSMAESVPCVYQTRFLSVWGSRLDYTF